MPKLTKIIGNFEEKDEFVSPNFLKMINSTILKKKNPIRILVRI